MRDREIAGNGSLHRFGAYQKACVLFDLVVTDVTPLARNPVFGRRVSLHVASADSIAANIEEGYGRGSRKDYAHFLVISRGSATETRGRYEQRLKLWLPPGVIAERVLLCEEIIAILSAAIIRLRSDS